MLCDKKSFLKYFVKLALPVAAQQLIVNLVSMIDTVMVGGIGESSISAISVANKFFVIYTLAIFGLTNGVGLFISQYHGANDKANSNRVLRFGLILVGVVGALTTLVVWVAPRAILELFVNDEEIIMLGIKYNAIVSYSYIVYGISQMLSIAYRVSGDSTRPLIASCVSVIINIVLNYLLIFGKFSLPALGVEGAAWATLIARCGECLLLSGVLLQRDEYYDLKTTFGLLSRDQMWMIAKKAMPLIANETIWAASLSLIFINYCRVDESYIPALTIVDQISSLSYVVFAGFASAVGIVMGDTLGANELEEAKRLSKVMIRIGLCINLITSLIVASSSYVIPRLYSLSEESTIIATRLLLIKCSVMWTQGYSETVYYILRAGGDTKSVFFIDGFFMVCGPVLMSYIFTYIFSVPMYALFAIVEGVAVLKIQVSTYFYRKETWIRNLTHA